MTIYYRGSDIDSAPKRSKHKLWSWCLLADLKNDPFAHSSHWKIFSKASCWVTETLFQQLYGFRHSSSEGVHLQRHSVSELEHQKPQSSYLHLGGGFRRSERKELSWGSSYLLMPGTMKNRTYTWNPHIQPCMTRTRRTRKNELHGPVHHSGLSLQISSTHLSELAH